MDSKQVTKAINLIIRPMLKANGFDKFTGRTYWRYHCDRIDILNFESFNAYNADVLGCTTFSFGVKLAVFMNYIPMENVKEKNGLKRPKEYEGHFRSHIDKAIVQKEFPRKDIWFVDKEGKYLETVILDCKAQIEREALIWYERFDKKENVLQILLEEDEQMEKTWGFGNKGSAVRNKFIAYTALELNKKELAKNKLNEVVEFHKSEYENTKKYSKMMAQNHYEKMKILEEKIKTI